MIIEYLCASIGISTFRSVFLHPGTNYHSITFYNYYSRMNIYVGNLSRQASEVEVRALFAQFGEVKSVKIIKDNFSGEPRGFAFVEMPEASAGSQAIKELDSQEFGDKRLKVNEAEPKNTTEKAFNSFSSPYGYKNRHSSY